ncbi:hypothetical protein BD779DRAFT_1541906 [Infundibulicybe gibba]|nr:hypothetical protein BD779DRAFT_1541906 [Infundibulicybe gibba]
MTIVSDRAYQPYTTLCSDGYPAFPDHFHAKHPRPHHQHPLSMTWHGTTIIDTPIYDRNDVTVRNTDYHIITKTRAAPSDFQPQVGRRQIRISPSL